MTKQRLLDVMFFHRKTLYILKLTLFCVSALFQAPVEITACDKNVTKVVVTSGQTAILSFPFCPPTLNCADDSFLGHRVFKNNESFTYIGNGELAGNCTPYSALKNFCVSKTELEKLNDSLILTIRSATLDDGGLYAIEYIFKNFSGNSREEKCLEVTVEENPFGTTTSPPLSTQDYSDSPETPTTSRSGAISSPVQTISLVFLLCFSLWLRSSTPSLGYYDLY